MYFGYLYILMYVYMSALHLFLRSWIFWGILFINLRQQRVHSSLTMVMVRELMRLISRRQYCQAMRLLTLIYS